MPNPFSALDDEEPQVVAPAAPVEAPKALKPAQPRAGSAKAPAGGARSGQNNNNKGGDNKAPRDSNARRAPKADGPRAPKTEGARVAKADGAASGTDYNPEKRDDRRGTDHSGKRQPREGFNTRNAKNSHSADKTETHKQYNRTVGDPKDPHTQDAVATEEEEKPEAPVVEAEPKPEEPVQLTLDEYRRQQAKRLAQAQLPAVRKAGEGEDASRWGNSQELTKEEEEEETTQEATTDRKTQQRSHRKQAFEINVSFQSANAAPRTENNNNFRGRGRGGFRGGRGGRGGRTGGPRSDSKSAPAFQISELEKDFPKL